MTAIVTSHYVRRGLRISFRSPSSWTPRQDFTCSRCKSAAGRGREADLISFSHKRWLVTQRPDRIPIISPEKNKSYQRIIGDLLKSRKFQSIQSSLELQGLWSYDIYNVLRYWLLSKSSLETNQLDWDQQTEGWLTQNEHTHQSFVEMLTRQQHIFRKHMVASWKNNDGWSSDEFPVSFFPVTQMIFAELAQQCTKQPTIALVIWDKTKESGIHLDESTSKSLLKSMHSGMRTISNEDNEESAKEIAMYYEFMHGKNEITVSIQALYLLRHGNAEMAEQLLRNFDLHHDRNAALPNQRSSTISNALCSVLEAYCQSSNVDGAVSMFRRLKRRRGPKPSLKMHMLILSCLSTNGCLR